MATLMSPFIMVSCVQESETITYRGYFLRVAFFPVSQRSHAQGSASLNWRSSINHSTQIPLPATHPLNRDKKARLLGSPQSTKDGTKSGKDNVNKERMDKWGPTRSVKEERRGIKPNIRLRHRR